MRMQVPMQMRAEARVNMQMAMGPVQTAEEMTDFAVVESQFEIVDLKRGITSLMTDSL